MSDTTGNATENGEQKTEQQAPPPEKKPENSGSVPYTRFQEVVEQRKGLESTLNSLIDGMVAELPEDMRDLVPNLPPAEKAAWIRTANAKGLFSKTPTTVDTPTSSPDAKRPTGKPPQDFSGLSPLQKMQAGYGQK